MKITDIKITLFRRSLPRITHGLGNAMMGGENVMALIAVETDEGVTGHSFLGAASKTAEVDVHSLAIVLRPALVGQDPLQREYLYERMLKFTRHTTWRCIGAVDVALWDLCGKVAGLPVYQLIGGHRREVPAYASSAGHAGPGDYVREALDLRAQGYPAYKIHPPRRGWRLDVEVCEKVRQAVGPDYTLMVDPAWVYTYPEALRVGRELERLNYAWFEDPLEKDDVYNCAKLREKLDIPIMATQDSPGGFHAYTPWITERATDYLRGDVAVKGGITGCLKIAHLAEAFRLNFEVHHGGNSINNFANLHLMCAIPNAEFFEIILPDSTQQYAVLNDLKIDARGMLRVPETPGLGAEIDFDLIGRTSIGTL